MANVLRKQKKDMEQAFYQLMYQFRQIDQKYGLMVKEELHALYNKGNQGVHDLQQWMDQKGKVQGK